MSIGSVVGGFRPLVVRALEALGNAGHVASDIKSTIASGEENGQIIESIVTYLDELRTWNARVDLTAARSAEEAVDLTLADAVVLATHGESAAGARHDPFRWVDVGAGAGAPGLILAMLRPNWSMTLVEPRSKRVAFLRSVIGRLNVPAELRRARSDDLDDKQWDVAISRATLGPTEWLDEGVRLARHAVWVLLAKGDAPVRAGWRADRNISYRWPLTAVERRAICFVPQLDP